VNLVVNLVERPGMDVRLPPHSLVRAILACSADRTQWTDLPVFYILLLHMALKGKPIAVSKETGPDRFRHLLADIEQTLQVTLTIKDFRGVFRARDGTALFPGRGSHTHAYCELQRKTVAGWNQNCWDHCQAYVTSRCERERAPFVTCCWKGALEVIVPVVRDGSHVGTLYAGAFRDPDGRGKPTDDGFPKKVRDAYAALPILHTREVPRLARMLQALGLGFLNLVDQIHLEQETDLDRRAIIRRFIYYHAQEPVRLPDLACALCLSPSRTSHVVQELFGVSFRELLIRERIARARALLVSSPDSVGQIARRVGVPNEFYFNRLFKKMVGVAPGRFRRARVAPVRRAE